ncbi:hypothetical protein AB3N62_11025 [Leptospira sp. WS4.C2]
MKPNKIKNIIYLILLILNYSSCNVSLRENYSEDKVFLLSIRELSELELSKRYKIKNISLNSVNFFLISVANKQYTRMNEAAGFLTEFRTKFAIRKFGHEQRYKSAKIIDAFHTDIDFGFLTFDILIAFSKSNPEQLAKLLAEMNYQLASPLNEKIINSSYFDTYDEKSRIECNENKAKELKAKLSEKYPEGIPDIALEKFDYNVYIEQISCWGLKIEHEK